MIDQSDLFSCVISGEVRSSLFIFSCRFASTTGFKLLPGSRKTQVTTGCQHWLKKHPYWASEMYCSVLNRRLTVPISTIFIFSLCFPSSLLPFRQLLSVRMTRTNRFYSHLPLLIPLCPWIFPSLSPSCLLSSPLPPLAFIRFTSSANLA